MRIRIIGCSGIEIRDQGQSFGLIFFFFFFFEMGDTEEVSLQVEMIQEKGLLMCVSYVYLGGQTLRREGI